MKDEIFTSFLSSQIEVVEFTDFRNFNLRNFALMRFEINYVLI
jgi:hypothetical protein